MESGTGTLFKKRLRPNCFPVNFVRFLRTPFYTKHFQWLLLFEGNVTIDVIIK